MFPVIIARRTTQSGSVETGQLEALGGRSPNPLHELEEAIEYCRRLMRLPYEAHWEGAVSHSGLQPILVIAPATHANDRSVHREGSMHAV